jgi:hypothetical protein
MSIKKNLVVGERASTLVVVLSVVATILTLLGAAVTYTQHVSRVADRSRKTAQAVEVADGHMEYLFTHWRNIYRMQKGANPILPTNYFWTAMFPGAPTTDKNPGPPPIIPLPPATTYPDVNYTVTRYSIQAVNPMVDLMADGETSTLAPRRRPPVRMVRTRPENNTATTTLPPRTSKCR